MRLNTDSFDYNRKTFTADISSLVDVENSEWSALKPNTKWKGIFLTSHKTGTTIRYFLKNTIRNRAGDTIQWILWPMQDDVKMYSSCAYSKIVINNV